MGVRQVQFRFDIVGKTGQQISIDEIERVDDGQKEQQAIGRCADKTVRLLVRITIHFLTHHTVPFGDLGSFPIETGV